MQQTYRVTFAADAATYTGPIDTNSGFPQVSVLTFKKQKDDLKKRRQAIIAGKGRNYRAIGTHRRSTTKHTWTYGELAELSATFIEHYNTKPIWKIAEEIHAMFAVQLTHQQALDAADADNQEEQVAQLREPRTHLPTIAAIELKLMDCISLNFNDTHNYISKPSQMHCEVWAHLLRAQKHRTMIRSMTMMSAKPEQQQPAAQQPAAQQQAEAEDQDREIWNVHSSEFLYDTVAEYEAAFPEAKRRKFNTSASVVAEEVVVGEMDMADVCEALEEIATEVETREQVHQQNNAAIALSMSIIRQQQQDIATLLEYMEHTQSGIEICQQRINVEMAKIDAIVQRGSTTTTTTTTTATATATATATVAPAHVDPNDQFDPEHHECRECSQMFDPLVPGYWLIGPNRETGDTFYLCRECTQFMEAEETPQTLQTSTPPTRRIDEDEDEDEDEEDYNYDSDDYQDYQDDDEPKQGDYDHSEECS
jgi:hypothetical protein